MECNPSNKELQSTIHKEPVISIYTTALKFSCYVIVSNSNTKYGIYTEQLGLFYKQKLGLFIYICIVKWGLY